VDAESFVSKKRKNPQQMVRTPERAGQGDEERKLMETAPSNGLRKGIERN